MFIEEAEEIVEELNRLIELWRLNPEPNEQLREIRRHFHTFKGNGRAVGANILGELGWAAQDMLDRVLDGELAPSDKLQQLVAEVVAGLPPLVSAYKTAGKMDATIARELTRRCFKAAKSGGDDLAEDMPAAEARSSGQLNLAEQPPLA